MSTSAFITDWDVWRHPTRVPEVYAYKVGAVLVVALIALGVARIVSGRVRLGLSRAGVGPNPALLIARIIRLGVWLVAALSVLAIFNVPFTALAAVVGATVLALSLSLQDLLKNLIAGIYLLAERPFNIGDRITVAGVSGIIDDIQMRVTYLHNDLGERIIMPNQTVFTEVIVANRAAAGGADTSSLTVSTPRSIGHDDLSRLAVAALGTVDGATPPCLVEATCMSPDATSWRISFPLGGGRSASEALLALGEAIPEATISLAPGT